MSCYLSCNKMNGPLYPFKTRYILEGLASADDCSSVEHTSRPMTFASRGIARHGGEETSIKMMEQTGFEIEITVFSEQYVPILGQNLISQYSQSTYDPNTFRSSYS